MMDRNGQGYAEARQRLSNAVPILSSWALDKGLSSARGYEQSRLQPP